MNGGGRMDKNIIYGITSIFLSGTCICIICIVDDCSIADNIFHYLKLSPWSRGGTGLHISNFLVLPLEVIAFLISRKAEPRKIAKVGKCIAFFMISVLLLSGIEYCISSIC